MEAISLVPWVDLVILRTQRVEGQIKRSKVPDYTPVNVDWLGHTSISNQLVKLSWAHTNISSSRFPPQSSGKGVNREPTISHTSGPPESWAFLVADQGRKA
jgi:hypothetical protein